MSWTVRTPNAPQRTDPGGFAHERDSEEYIKKTIRRLAILEDVPALHGKLEIAEALMQWGDVLYREEAEALARWLYGMEK